MNNKQRGEQYISYLSEICELLDGPKDFDKDEISELYRQAFLLLADEIDDIYFDETFEAITKGFTHTEIGIGYIYFIERYISFCINCHQNEIQELRPLLDYISTNMSDYFNIDYYKELNKAINNEIEGFETICSSDEIREKIYDYIVSNNILLANNKRFNCIDWTTGVYDVKRKIFITQTGHYVIGVDGITEDYYIVITDKGEIFTPSVRDDYFDKTTIYSIPEKYKYMSEIIKEGITYYDRYNSFEYQFYFLRNDTQEMNKKIENKMQERCQKYSRDTSQ